MPVDANPIIYNPSGFAMREAIAFGGEDGAASLVARDNPLPVAAGFGTARSTALAGTLTGSATAGPFVPDLGRPIWITLTGSWTGRIDVQRSTDGGATRLPLTIGGDTWASFAANAQEQIGEETMMGATYYLTAALTAGTAGYRVAQ